MTAKARKPDEMEVKAMKAMGAMEEGDAVFGSGAEVNLDSQVCLICLLYRNNITIFYYLNIGLLPHHLAFIEHITRCVSILSNIMLQFWIHL
jgi:hypothetical protein